MEVTPLLAEQWLARGGINRRVQTFRVKHFAEQMRRGEWRQTYEPIKLDAQGRVRDGQHRLRALIEAGVPVQFLVVTDVTEDAFIVMDSGRPRSLSDVFHMQDVESPRVIAAAVRILVLWGRRSERGIPSAGGSAIVSKPEAVEFLRINRKTLEPWVADARRITLAGVRGGDGFWTAMLFIFSQLSAEDTLRFAEYLDAGADMPKGHPILMLREQLRMLEGARASINPTAALAIKAWNAWRKKQPLTRLIYRANDKFPEPA